MPTGHILWSVHLKVTIFGTQAYQLSQYLKENPTVNCVVIVMQFVKLNIWDGVGQAKSHFEITKMFINSDIVEINEYKKRLKSDDNLGKSEKSITSLQSYSSSYIDDFKGTFPLKTICEITEPLKEMKFLLVASIVNIRQNLHWYYEACYKCGKKTTSVPKHNHSYTDPHKIIETVVVQCKDPSCNNSDFRTVIKYIIPINVQDGTGTIGLTLFDREAKRLLDISAYELKKIHEACKDPSCNNSDFRTVIKYIIPINVQDGTGTIGLTLFDREAKRLLDISAYELKKIHEACKDPSCNNLDFRTVIKYIIPINVQDGTGTIGLTLFDREAKRLLDISAYELKKIHEAAGDSHALFPMQLNVLKNRKFAFLVDITKYNVNNYNNIYTILKLTEDVSIVSELESKLELMSIESVSLNQVPLESDDVVQSVQKDVISQTDESFTPLTVNKSTTTTPGKISTDLKRNLQDIYDVDSGDDLSSTKAKRKSIGEETPLLIPKVEK
ncbi:unnamed protein product [Lactuca saligna]|uniref:Replication factor A C-terminal domain-containing protein n=1 Tax=Lactuca saligna TaxID=75948 RepID=A0AA35Y5P4_LACSI|nr:unnamed protein product [Lactuca saligna]